MNQDESMVIIFFAQFFSPRGTDSSSLVNIIMQFHFGDFARCLLYSGPKLFM